MYIPIIIVGKDAYDIKKDIVDTKFLMTLMYAYVYIYVEKDRKKVIKNKFGNQDFEFTDIDDFNKKIGYIPDEYLKIIKEFI